MTPSEIIFSVQESPEGGYHARALGFSIFTEADSLAELEAMIRDAVSCRVPQTSVLRLGLSFGIRSGRFVTQTLQQKLLRLASSLADTPRCCSQIGNPGTA